MRHVARLLVAFTAATVTGTLLTVPAQATEPSWQVGQCFNLTESQIAAEAIPTDAAPVPCTSAHNAEVTFAGSVDVSTKAKKAKALSQHCSVSDQYAAIGLPIRKAIETNTGAWPNLGNFNWITPDGRGLACAVAVRDYAKAGQPGALMLPSPLKGLATADRMAASAAVGSCFTDVTPDKRKSITCDPSAWSSSPWMLTRLVNAKAKFGNKFPGTAALKKYAFAQCGSGMGDTPWYAWWPLADGWTVGTDLIYCFRRAGL